MQGQKWNNAVWGSKARLYLSQHLMRQAEYCQFLAQRAWLEAKFQNFDLSQAIAEVEDGATRSLLQTVKPRLLLYGSSVAGTAFVHGDADYAVVFPAPDGLESRITALKVQQSPSAEGGSEPHGTKASLRSLGVTAGLVTVNRLAQPSVLTSLHDSMIQGTAGNEAANSSRPQLQRIFRARIPIMQYIPSLAELQQRNRDVKPSSDTTATASTPLQFIKSPSPALKVKEGLHQHHKKEHFDISLSVDGGRNSLLIRSYMESYPSLRVACLVLKQWGRQKKILNARRGWISPYALTIMLIHFMHASGRIPSLIDPISSDATLKRVAEQMVMQQASTPAAVAGSYGVDELDCLLPVEALLQSDTAFNEVADIVHGFLAYYGGADGSTFDFDTHVVDIRTNRRVLSKEEWFTEDENKALSDDEKWHRLGYGVLMIRDPFELHSLGRSVEFFRSESIREDMRVAANNGIDLDTLLPTASE